MRDAAAANVVAPCRLRCNGFISVPLSSPCPTALSERAVMQRLCRSARCTRNRPARRCPLARQRHYGHAAISPRRTEEFLHSHAVITGTDGDNGQRIGGRIRWFLACHGLMLGLAITNGQAIIPTAWRPGPPRTSRRMGGRHRRRRDDVVTSRWNVPGAYPLCRRPPADIQQRHGS